MIAGTKGVKRTAATISFMIVMLLSALVLVPGQSAAKQIAGTVTISEGDYYGWRMDVVMPSVLEYNISCLNGSRVDVLVLDESGFSNYTHKTPFEFYKSYSSVNASSASANFTVMSGTVYVIVDNSDYPQGNDNSPGSGTVEIEYWLASSFDFDPVPNEGNSWAPYVVVAILAITLAAVIYVTRRVIKDWRSGVHR